MTLAGYSHVTQVVAPGEYSFRGGLIDLYPMGSALPYRIDLFDDEIKSIRSFDVDTQRSIYKVNEVRLLPAREFPMDEAAQTRFRKLFAKRSKAIRRGRASTGTSRKAFHGRDGELPAALLRAHGAHHRLPADGDHRVRYPGLGTRSSVLGDATAATHGARGPRESSSAAARAVPHREELFGEIKPFPRIELGGAADGHSPTGEAGATVFTRRTIRRDATLFPCSTPLALPHHSSRRRCPRSRSSAAHPSRCIAFSLSSSGNGRVLLLAESPGRRETMLDYFVEYVAAPHAGLRLSPSSSRRPTE